jgi:hypothetical protein
MVEFGPTDLLYGDAAVRCFELLAVASLSLIAVRGVWRTWTEAVLLPATLYLAIGTVRHINLFAIVATPVVARGLTRLLAVRAPRVYERWQVIAREQEVTRSWRVHLPLLAALVLALAATGHSPLPATLDDLQLTRGAMDFVAAHPERFARPFNTDALAGALIYRFWPGLHVFVDDRTNVYPEAFYVDDYFTVLYGRPGWTSVLDRWGITSAIVPMGTPCAARLRASPAWGLEYKDARIAIFSRHGAARSDVLE